MRNICVIPGSLFLLIGCFFFSAFSAMAQENGLLRGWIKADSGAVAYALISLTANNGQRSAISDQDGAFVLRDLPPGSYTIIISATGFDTLRRSITLRKGEVKELHFLLHQRLQQLSTVTVIGSHFRKTDDLIDVRKIANPVTIINRRTIEMMGSRRLDEVLREQTGLSIVSDLGSGNRSVGLQMQGFSSEYIAILINGQPLTGRIDGNFDLSRISVSDIERIEIIKGASSSLYGSEALGGVINIITRQRVQQSQATAALRYGTFNTLDATGEGAISFHKEKGSAWLSANYYRTDGFNVNTQYLKQGQTSPPFNSVLLQGRSAYRFAENYSLQLSGRFSNRHSVMTRSYGAQQFNDALKETDLNGALALGRKLQERTNLLLRYYFTRYSTVQEIAFHDGGALLQNNRFVQTIHRAELQATHELPKKKVSFTGGAGGDYQELDYSQQVSGESMYNSFAYLQANYKQGNRYELIAGLRYDHNNLFGGKLNPSFGAGYRFAPWLHAKLSVGQGFKAPTYTQLYQVFTNMVQGYTVIGANVFSRKAPEMKNAGMIQQLWPVAENIRPLKPETSTSFNAGVTLTPFASLEWSLQGFYNIIENQVFSQQVGIMAGGQQLYSYINVAKAFTSGGESSVKWSPLRGLMLTASYQYLVAKDKGIIDSIKAGQGKYSKVRAHNGIRESRAADYFNLPNRSRHSAGVQVFYDCQPLGLGFSFRGNYRGKYGFLDIDNNGYIDPYDVYVKGFFLCYASVQKKLLQDRLTIQASIDNIFDYTDYLMPAQPGRMLMAGISWRFIKKRAPNNLSDNNK